MERVIKYFNEKLPGFDGQIVNVSADGKSFIELASDIYDDMLTNDKILDDFKKYSNVFNYKKQNRVKEEYKRSIIKSIRLFVKHHIGIIYSLVDSDNVITIDNACAYKLNEEIASDKVIKKLHNMCAYSEELFIYAFTNNYFCKKEYHKGISFDINQTYQYMVKNLLDYTVNDDLLRAIYQKYNDFITAEDMFNSLTLQQTKDDDAIMQLYLWNRVTFYPLINILRYSTPEFERDKRMEFFIKAFYKFGYQKVYQVGFKKAKELIFKSMLYEQCMEVKDKYELNKGYVLIGAPTETKFKNISTIEDYIATLNVDERRALKDINNSSDIEEEKGIVDAELNTVFKQMMFAFRFSELLSVKIIKATVDYIEQLDNRDKIEYVSRFYKGIDIGTIPTDIGVIKKSDEMHMMKILSDNKIRNATLKSVDYFIDLHKYLKGLYKKKKAYNELKLLITDQHCLDNIREAINDLEEVKNDNLFSVYEYAIKELAKYRRRGEKISDELLYRYYPQVYKFFEKCHENIGRAFITMGIACTKLSDLVDKDDNRLCKEMYYPATKPKETEDIGHYFKGFRRLYKFDFDIKEMDIKECSMQIRRIVKNK